MKMKRQWVVCTMHHLSYITIVQWNLTNPNGSVLKSVQISEFVRISDPTDYNTEPSSNTLIEHTLIHKIL